MLDALARRYGQTPAAIIDERGDLSAWARFVLNQRAAVAGNANDQRMQRKAQIKADAQARARRR